jgi:hypothetical protein
MSLFYLGLHSFRYTPKNGSSTFNFLRNPQIAFHSRCTHLHSHQGYKGSFFTPHPHQHLLLFVLLMIAILSEVREKYQCSFDLHFLYGQGSEHFFMYLLVICTSVENCLFGSFFHLLIRLLIL